VPGSNFRLFAVFAITLVAVYALPLYRLLRHSMENQLWSHVLLIPGVSLYLVWIRRRQLPAAACSFSPYAGIPLLLGIVVTSIFRVMNLRGHDFARTDHLAITTLSFVLFLISGAGWILSPAVQRS
jgi:hypothetical protein